jgi:putative lipase involved disintegration of autophagic bodies
VKFALHSYHTTLHEQNLVDEVLHIYPNADIWLVGHSLGGALASLLGSTYGIPAVAFESPGERLAASRLHLPLPPSNGSSNSGRPPLVPVTHVYNTGDPIPQGTCTGFTSLCARMGYALETKCHLGKSIVLDTVQKLQWTVGVRNHPIKEVIFKVLEADGVEWGDGIVVPLAQEEVDCVVSLFPIFLPPFGVILRRDIGLSQMGVWRFLEIKSKVHQSASLCIISVTLKYAGLHV